MFARLGTLWNALKTSARRGADAFDTDRRVRRLERDVVDVQMSLEQYRLAYHALAERALDAADSIDLKRARIEQAARRAEGKGRKTDPPEIVDSAPVDASEAVQSAFKRGTIDHDQAGRALLAAARANGGAR